MKKRVCIIAVMIMLPVIVWAGGVISDGSLTVTSTLKALTSSVPDDVASAMITVDTAAVRFTLKSSITSTGGHKLSPGDVLYLDNRRDIVSFRVLNDTSTAATLYYSLSK